MSIKTPIYPYKDDLGKNLYRQKVYYTLVLEQDVLANSREEAEKIFLDKGGIDYAAIDASLAEERGGIETNCIYANYDNTDKVAFLGKVVYDDYDEYCEENGEVKIDYYADKE